MNRTHGTALLLALALILATGTTCHARQSGPVDPVRIVELRDSLATAIDFWPGFDPRTTALAIAVRDTTWLFGPADQPEGFTPAPRGTGWIMQGRHPSITANSWCEIDGIPAASLLIDSTDTKSTLDWTAIALHEAFHVFQRTYTGWQTNEVDLFLYPLDNVEALALRRQETAALKNAVLAENVGESDGWREAALKLRHKRYGLLNDAAPRYERSVEVVEGTAFYVETLARKALGLAPDFATEVPDSGFPLASVRLRCYRTGLAWAMLLGRSDPEWRSEVVRPWLDGTAGDTLAPFTPLDVLTARCPLPEETVKESIPTDFVANADRQAKADVEAYKDALRAAKDAFTRKQGWKIVVEANTHDLLQPMGFDPMNIVRLGDGDVMHRRFVVLANHNAKLQVMNREAITHTGNGTPLFGGVDMLVVNGLKNEPELHRGAKLDTLVFDGGTFLFRGEHVEKEGLNMNVVLPK